MASASIFNICYMGIRTGLLLASPLAALAEDGGGGGVDFDWQFLHRQTSAQHFEIFTFTNGCTVEFWPRHTRVWWMLLL